MCFHAYSADFLDSSGQYGFLGNKISNFMSLSTRDAWTSYDPGSKLNLPQILRHSITALSEKSVTRRKDVFVVHTLEK